MFGHRSALTILLILTGVLLLTLGPATAQTPLTVDTIATGLEDPLFLTYAPGDSTRLFILEQTGKIRIVRNDTLLTRAFLDLTTSVICCGEQGLLGLAFHPDYQTNGYFYVNYTAPGGTNGITTVSRFQVTADPDSADIASELILLTIDQPYSNHNGGMIGFGPTDGYLYIGTGDGGLFNDPDELAQNPQSLLGKMLRIDVDNQDPGKNYAIPASNPWATAVDTLPEIWALGLRNPWRWSFDREAHNLYIADVGQGSIEEVNFQPAASTGGENYGWDWFEGTNCFESQTVCDTATFQTPPFVEYGHSSGRCSVTGGYVYRGCAVPDLQGTYFYGDYCTAEIWSLRYDGSTVTDSTKRNSELGIFGSQLTSFGEDYFGELYITYQGGAVVKIIPDGVASQCGTSDCCVGNRGNVDDDAQDLVDVGDLTTAIDFLFLDGPTPNCPAEANADSSQDGVIDVGDLTYLIDFLFLGGPQPGPCP